MTTTTEITQTEAVQLLRTVINASGLSDRQWAMKVAWRDERTIRRWLAGDAPIPKMVIYHLLALHARDGDGNGNGVRS
jgi:hypothetical protein